MWALINVDYYYDEKLDMILFHTQEDATTAKVEDPQFDHWHLQEIPVGTAETKVPMVHVVKIVVHPGFILLGRTDHSLRPFYLAPVETEVTVAEEKGGISEVTAVAATREEAINAIDDWLEENGLIDLPLGEP